MCGIFGYIGDEDPLKTCLAGLEQLEYRGYDSSGIAGIKNGEIAICKEIGKLSKLKEKLNQKNLKNREICSKQATVAAWQSKSEDSHSEARSNQPESGSSDDFGKSPERLDIAIGHTRWATHGKVTNQNAHPHKDSKETLALVHNGIIENCDTLREELQRQGVVFVSETDTEVMTNLIAKNYHGDLVEAVQKSLPFLKGHFAIALIHKDHPDRMVAAARECPLSIGYNDARTESIVSSDPNAFLGRSLNILFLRNDEIAKVEKGKVEVFDRNLRLVEKKTERLDGGYKVPSKEGFEHFMLKEIYEQPSTIQKAILGRFHEGQVHFESLSQEFKNAPSVWFIGCGTSANAGSIGALLLEEIAKIPARCEIASEARYRIIPPGTLVVAISQSGETADTISAVREVKARGLKVLGVCNVKNSTLTRETDGCIFLKAGPEMSVCSTKAFTSQIAVLYLFALYMAGQGNADELKKIPSQIQEVIENVSEIRAIAKKYSRYNNFFFMGRRYMFPTCMEAALKLKEISYLNANGYAAGELKHGPIALIDAHFPVIAFLANHQTEEKMLSNLQEVKARGAPILALAPKNLSAVSKIADDVIWLPAASDPLSPFSSTVAGQILAYYIAKERGCDIDQPRNLAKSVTVE